MTAEKNTKFARNACTVLFSVLICLGSFMFIALPDGIPITVQNMFAALTGLVLGGLQGAGAVGLFLLLGAAGLPVFSGCRGGLAVLQGASGGFLIGYFPAALAGGLIIGSPLIRERKTAAFIIRLFAAACVAFGLPYLFGIPWFMAVREAEGNAQTLSQAFSAALLPFIPGDCIKIMLSCLLACVFRPLVARLLYPDDIREAEELLHRIESRSPHRKA
ncbi:MAG: biotin transporter BioY [Treponema sp.]|nr:biotin transporter BioY [Treponema sp.]